MRSLSKRYHRSKFSQGCEFYDLRFQDFNYLVVFLQLIGSHDSNAFSTSESTQPEDPGGLEAKPESDITAHLILEHEVAVL
jgi:hypothetical protein